MCLRVFCDLDWTPCLCVRVCMKCSAPTLLGTVSLRATRCTAPLVQSCHFPLRTQRPTTPMCQPDPCLIYLVRRPHLLVSLVHTHTCHYAHTIPYTYTATVPFTYTCNPPCKSTPCLHALRQHNSQFVSSSTNHIPAASVVQALVRLMSCLPKSSFP